VRGYSICGSSTPEGRALFHLLRSGCSYGWQQFQSAVMMKNMAENRDFDIALSFAGEERDYVDRVANLLKERGVKVFYDLFEEADLWGKDLYVHLSEVYHKRARFTVMFISDAYAKKLWTNHERKSAQARAFQEAQEYILPARFDDTDIPGVLSTVGYVSLKNRSRRPCVPNYQKARQFRWVSTD
jgi:hypothetical protein